MTNTNGMRIREYLEKLIRYYELEKQLEEMDEIYGDNFPEPSEQLDRWNTIFDELSELETELRNYYEI